MPKDGEAYLLQRWFASQWAVIGAYHTPAEARYMFEERCTEHPEWTLRVITVHASREGS